jgi:hypothetical protein
LNFDFSLLIKRKQFLILIKLARNKLFIKVIAYLNNYDELMDSDLRIQSEKRRQKAGENLEGLYIWPRALGLNGWIS